MDYMGRIAARLYLCVTLGRSPCARVMCRRNVVFYTTCLLLRLSHVYIYLLSDTSLSGTLMYYSTDGLIWIWALQSYVA